MVINERAKQKPTHGPFNLANVINIFGFSVFTKEKLLKN